MSSARETFELLWPISESTWFGSSLWSIITGCVVVKSRDSSSKDGLLDLRVGSKIPFSSAYTKPCEPDDDLLPP